MLCACVCAFVLACVYICVKYFLVGLSGPTRRVGDAESEGHPSVARKTTGKIGVAKCPPFPAMSGSQAGFRLSSGREIFARRGVSSSKAVDSGCCEEREDSSSSADSSEETGVLSTKEEEMDLESRLSDTPVANKQSETRKVDFSSKSTSFSSKSISSKKKFSPLPRTREQTRESSASKSSGKHRYIAFIGNLPFNAHSEDVASHFNKKGVVTTQVRLLTDKKSGQSRGCCFVEFPNAKTLQVQYELSHNSKCYDYEINFTYETGIYLLDQLPFLFILF